MEAVLVDVEHLQGLGPGLLGRCVDGVALLPEELRGAQEGPRHFLPAQDVAPLVYEDWEVAVALDPVLVEVADDALARRPDGEPLLQHLPPPYRHPRELRVEALDVLGLLLQVTLGDEERKVGVLVARGLEAVVEVALDALPDLEPVRPYGEGPPNRPVIRQLRHPDKLQVPLARVFALLRKLFDRLGHTDAPLLMQMRTGEEYSVRCACYSSEPLHCGIAVTYPAKYKPPGGKVPRPGVGRNPGAAAGLDCQTRVGSSELPGRSVLGASL